MEQKNEISWINTAKGIGIVLVAYGHVIRGLNNAGIFTTDFFTISDYLIYSFHMPLFFFLSGIFFFKSFDKRGLKLFAINKINSLLYLYVLWSIIQFLIQVIMNNYINTKVSFDDLVFLFIEPKGQMWFVYILLLLFLFTGILFNFIKKENRKIAVSLLILTALFLRIYAQSDIYILNKVNTNSLFFFLGLLFYLFDIKMNNYSKWLIIVLSLTSYLVVVFFNLSKGNLDYDQQIIPAILGVLFICLLSPKSIIKNIFNYLGRYSLEIYLSHIIFASGIRIFLQKVLNIDMVFIHIFTGVAFGLFIPLMLVKLSSKYKVLNFLFKNKIIKNENI